ncbi:DNA polymerase III subunit delta [Candidatus Phytoplasma sacchari]|nr:DNA polymerase III subunit delta [Candidatus Phytoplasma sacchari]
MKIYYLNLFFYEQNFFKEKQKNILKKFCEKNKYYFVHYKIEKDNYKDIIQNLEEEINTNSLFADKKVILIENISLLINNENKNKSITNFSFLFNYFKKIRKDIFLYFVEKKDTFNIDIKKIFEKYFLIKKINPIQKKEIIPYVFNIFKKDNFIIKNKIVYKIIEKTNGDLILLNREIEKIKLYYWNFNNKIIDNEKIIDQLIYSENMNIFLLINSFLNKKRLIDNFIFIKKTIIDKKQNFFLIISQILKKLKDFIIIKQIKKEKKNKEKIISIFKYFFKYSENEINFIIKESKNLKIEKIKSLFLFFSNLVYKIKKEKILLKNNLEIFFLMEMFENKFI